MEKLSQIDKLIEGVKDAEQQKYEAVRSVHDLIDSMSVEEVMAVWQDASPPARLAFVKSTIVYMTLRRNLYTSK